MTGTHLSFRFAVEDGARYFLAPLILMNRKHNTYQTHRFGMRINPKDRKRWERAAKKQDKPLSTWLRDLANEATCQDD